MSVMLLLFDLLGATYGHVSGIVHILQAKISIFTTLYFKSGKKCTELIDLPSD